METRNAPRISNEFRIVLSALAKNRAASLYSKTLGNLSLPKMHEILESEMDKVRIMSNQLAYTITGHLEIQGVFENPKNEIIY